MDKSKQKWYSCTFDNYKTKERVHLIKHIVYNHAVAGKCPFCDYKPEIINNLLNHIDNHDEI